MLPLVWIILTVLVFDVHIVFVSSDSEEYYSSSSEQSHSKSQASIESNEDDVYNVLNQAIKTVPRLNFTRIKPKPHPSTTRPPWSISLTPSSLPSLPTSIEDDDFDYDGTPQNWKTKDTVEGYRITSDGLQFRSKLLKKMKLVQIRVGAGDAWTLEKKYVRRNLELKIGRWDGLHRVHIKVPYGALPKELKVIEGLKYIDIYGPYGFLEFKKSSTPKPAIFPKTRGKIHEMEQSEDESESEGVEYS